MSPHTHHTQDEVIYVLEGEFSFASKDGALALGPGCVVCVPRGTVHALKVSGGEPGRCLLLLAPPEPLDAVLRGGRGARYRGSAVSKKRLASTDGN